MPYRKPADIPDYVDDVPLGDSTPPMKMPVKESPALWVAVGLLALEAGMAYWLHFVTLFLVACGVFNVVCVSLARIEHLLGLRLAQRNVENAYAAMACKALYKLKPNPIGLTTPSGVASALLDSHKHVLTEPEAEKVAEYIRKHATKA